MTVLIVAGERDRSANGVVRALGARGVDVARIDTAWFPQRLTLDAEFVDGHWVGELRTCSRTVVLDNVRAIWYRSPATFTLPEGMSSAERQYARTNRADSVRRFATAAGEDGVVTKALGTTLVYEEDHYKLGYTRRLTTSDLADLSGIDVTAHQQQVWVNKRRECRVVVVGDRVFAVAIHAGSEASHIDWRSDYPALSYQVVEPPDPVIEGVRGVMAQLGLVYGAFYFAVDQSDRWWFFEVNPGGVYGWLEYHTGVPITAALADLLAGEIQ